MCVKKKKPSNTQDHYNCWYYAKEVMHKQSAALGGACNVTPATTDSRAAALPNLEIKKGSLWGWLKIFHSTLFF